MREIDEYYKGLDSRFIYDTTNKPFNSLVPESIKELKKRIAFNLPGAIIIDGMSGMGKTTLGYHVIDEYQGFPIYPKLQHAQGNKEFLQKAKLCIKYKLPAIIYDEAGDSDKTRFWSELNQNFNRFFDLYRTFKLLPVIILPLFQRLEDSLFDKGIPRLLFHCFGKSKSFSRFKVYGLNRMLYLRAKMRDKNLISKQLAYNYVRPNYIAEFKDLARDRSKALDKFSSQGKLKEFHEMDIINRGLLTYDDLSRKVVRSQDWVKRQVTKLKIRESEIWKRRKYFEPKDLAKIKSHMKTHTSD